MTDEFFQFDSNRSQLIGRRTRRVIKLGDNLTVQIAKVDRFKKQVDFQLVKSVRPMTQPPPPLPPGNTPRLQTQPRNLLRTSNSPQRRPAFNRGRAKGTKPR